jgi:hypothetical protein
LEFWEHSGGVRQKLACNHKQVPIIRIGYVGSQG